MNATVQPGTRVSGDTSKSTYLIGDALGAGAQGEVVRATGSAGEHAIKWYLAKVGTTQQRLMIEKLVSAAAPSSHFLWPTDIVTAAGVPAFGYVMPLRPTSFISLDAIKVGRSGARLTTIVAACRNLAVAFRALHLKGLAYFDIKGNNGFFDPKTGEILICDIDSVTFSGGNPPIVGTLAYMAPELILGKANPTTDTDLHSLAVLLFEMLVRNHPLEGKLECAIKVLTTASLIDLYGRNPLFIFDLKDLRNRPESDCHDHATIFWSLLPTFVRDRFVTAFTDGLRNPKSRVLDRTWIETMVRLENSIVPCPSCSAEHFVDASPGAPLICRSCRQPIPRTPWLVISDPSKPNAGELHRIALHPAIKDVPPTRIYNDHIDSSATSFDRGGAVATVVINPNRPGMLGITNQSKRAWNFTDANGDANRLEPGETARIAPGVEIRFAGSNLVGKVVA